MSDRQRLAQLDVAKIRGDFPILKRLVNGKQLVYLDNAATTQKPRQVIEALKQYYETYNANIHRSIHRLGEEATHAYEEAHRKAAELINARGIEEIVFTSGTTASLNILAYAYGRSLKPGDEILLTQLEHHANLVPWQQIAKQNKLTLKFAKISNDGIDLGDFEEKLTEKTKVVSVSHVSNVLGNVNPVKKIGRLAKAAGAAFVVDGAQSVPKMPVDVKEFDCDFLAFSGHKMFGPTGIGVLYGRKDLLQTLEPLHYGGEMIKEVRFDDTKFNDLPWRFEAGTANIEGGIGLGVAIDYLRSLGLGSIERHEKDLAEYAFEKLEGVEGIEIYSQKMDNLGVVAFNLKGIHSHDVSQILDGEGIAIRAGHHCAMPLMGVLGIQACARASFYAYNTTEEIDKLVVGLQKVKKVFGV